MVRRLPNCCAYSCESCAVNWSSYHPFVCSINRTQIEQKHILRVSIYRRHWKSLLVIRLLVQTHLYLHARFHELVPRNDSQNGHKAEGFRKVFRRHGQPQRIGRAANGRVDCAKEANGAFGVGHGDNAILDDHNSNNVR